ncbi:MAG: alpha/beta hydrolase [Alphaproteobacteria bacterium]|nr:alpha/beta hydrolase [Alphaproteobacteria bacterium]
MHRRTILLASLAAACTPSLGAFNAVAPRDAGAARSARDLPYGDGPRHKLDVYAPRGATQLPVIVFIYGGSWSSGSKNDYAFAGAALASRGFVTVIPDYQLVPTVRFPTFIEDCAAAVRWVTEHAQDHGGDPSRILLVGHSAGAYNVMMLALDAHFLRDAGVDSTRVRGAVGLSGPYDFLPFDVDATRNAFGQAPDTALTQPVHFARTDAPPLLLLWGEADTTVGPRNLRSLDAAMRSVGAEVETKTYPGVNHVDIMLALSRPLRGRAPTLADVTAFAQRVTT